MPVFWYFRVLFSLQTSCRPLIFDTLFQAEANKVCNVISPQCFGIKSVSKGDIDMSVDNGMLTLSNVPENELVSVFSATGQLLGTGRGNISVDAQGAQMVIVKVGSRSYKVMAK